MVMFRSSVFDRKNDFWADLVQKLKIVSLSLNLVQRIIRTGNRDLILSIITPLIGKIP